MKKDNATPVCVYRDEIHEATTRIDIEKAMGALQNCLNIWNGLELIPCTDIFQLILNPQKVYGAAVYELAESPETFGRFAISKGAYINIFEIPVPDTLYRAARDARKHQFTNMPELWDISGNQIVMNTDAAEALMDSQSIYCNDPEKIKNARKFQDLVDLLNELNLVANHELFDSANPVDNRFFLQKFGFVGGDGRGSNATLTILPHKLKEWIGA